MDPGVEPYKPVKGKVNVLMAVGIQGAGKTTTCTKVSATQDARWAVLMAACGALPEARSADMSCLCGYLPSGCIRPAEAVCQSQVISRYDADCRNATKAKIPFYGSYTETDPVAIASLGVEKFRKGESHCHVLWSVC